MDVNVIRRHQDHIQKGQRSAEDISSAREPEEDIEVEITSSSIEPEQTENTE